MTLTICLTVLLILDVTIYLLNQRDIRRMEAMLQMIDGCMSNLTNAQNNVESRIDAHSEKALEFLIDKLDRYLEIALSNDRKAPEASDL